MAQDDDVAHANTMIRSMVGGHLYELGVSANGLVLRFSSSWEVSLGAATSVGDAPPVEATSVDCVAAHMPLLVADLDAVDIGADGTLALTLAGTTIRCAPEGDYEAWQLNGPDGELIVCLPSGELAIWSARPA